MSSGVASAVQRGVDVVLGRVVEPALRTLFWIVFTASLGAVLGVVGVGISAALVAGRRKTA
jgi:hypothetical protein